MDHRELKRLIKICIVMRKLLYRSVRSSFFFAVIFMMISCTKTEDMPPEVRIDRTGCARCRMLISDTRFAAAIKTDSYLIFDDIGCMIEYSRTHTNTLEASVWVREFGSDRWIHSEDAAFYLQENKQTPMGYGFIAVKKEASYPQNPIPGATFIGSLQELKAKFIAKS